MGTNGPEQRSIKSVITTFAIVDELIDRQGAGVTELSDALDCSKTTVHTHLSTLSQLGYVSQQGDEYHASLGFLSTGNRVRENFDFYHYGASIANSLAEKTGEVVHLAVEEDQMVHFVHATRGGPEAIESVTPIGRKTLLHATAVGKAMLAHMPDECRDAVLDRELEPMTSETITDRELLDEELELVRERGFAVNNQEQVLGARSVACPVKYVSGELMGAIAISGHASRLDDTRIEELAASVRGAANQIEIDQG
ncbi:MULTISPECIES: IclR family transcriptional regulator [Haloferax]|uniref:Helix-turn-helix domain-containing protein n=2 Tax=Haloferax TaxID=2251 RepID=A0A6G1Z6R4_9EURY|nr:MULTISPECIES: IclR family transcriptional regulator [Haloferax]KAB1185354.1 IclR family transcriptional regulator [Haloferax sp. CBA1149]MRW81994.1 helix-turn-helix domain-containing protein [Haloferax marinisediminis]